MQLVNVRYTVERSHTTIFGNFFILFDVLVEYN